jgi:hypothetical protein
MDTLNLMFSNATQEWEFIHSKHWSKVEEAAAKAAPSVNVADKGTVIASAELILEKLDSIPIYHCKLSFSLQ